MQLLLHKATPKRPIRTVHESSSATLSPQFNRILSNRQSNCLNDTQSLLLTDLSPEHLLLKGLIAVDGLMADPNRSREDKVSTIQVVDNYLYGWRENLRVNVPCDGSVLSPNIPSENDSEMAEESFHFSREIAQLPQINATNLANSSEGLLPKCPICNAILRNTAPSVLQEHMQSHEPPVVCENCGKTLSKRSLVRHMKTCNRNVVSRFQCTTCDKNFATSQTLARHVRRH